MHRPWNAHLGWSLLLAGWLWAVGLDPWSLGERDPTVLVGSPRMAARHAQAVVLAMGFLQLAVSLLLGGPEVTARGRAVAAGITLAGTLLYAAGYVGLALALPLAWVVPVGAAVNLLGFAVLTREAFRPPGTLTRRTVVLVFCLGMALDIVMGLFAADAGRFLPSAIGAEDGVRQRMLRLARVAATALSVLALLFEGHDADSPWSRCGRLAFVIACAGMPSILAAATFIHVAIKYALPVPALAATFAALVGLWQARQAARPLEQWGWLLVAVSMSVGLLVGLYAFDGPLPAPPTQLGYNDFARRLTRLGHAYAITLGLLAILAARSAFSPLAAGVLVAGSCLTLMAVTAAAFWPAATAALGAGPLLVALAVVAAWPWRHPEPARDALPPASAP